MNFIHLGLPENITCDDHWILLKLHYSQNIHYLKFKQTQNSHPAYMYQRNKTRATKTVPTQNKSNRKDQEGAKAQGTSGTTHCCKPLPAARQLLGESPGWAHLLNYSLFKHSFVARHQLSHHQLWQQLSLTQKMYWTAKGLLHLAVLLEGCRSIRKTNEKNEAM